jgi:capsular polysaccharide transport system permease protein
MRLAASTSRYTNGGAVQQKHPTPEIEPLELVPIGSVDEGAPRHRRSHIAVMTGLWAHRWFLLIVGLPTLVAAIYFGLIAADRFESESKFVVRSPGSVAASQITSLVGGSSIVRSSDDTYIVHAYMRSRDAVRKLSREIGLRALLARPEADVLWRYPGPLFRDNDERLWRHFQRFLSLEYDSTTGISTLKVQAFRAKDARDIAEMLLSDAELLINRLSDRSQGDAVRSASEEVERSRERARAALERITTFRRTHAVVDPGRMSNAALETMTRLALELAQTNAQLLELQKSSPDSPQATSLRHRKSALEEQIQRERAALAGADQSLAPLIAEYDRLVLEREFAERAFASAQSALDIARIEAQRQRLFLERISTPAPADYPRYPQRLLNILAVFAICMMLFAIGRALVSDTRAHGGR